MAYERLKNAALPHAVSDVVADLADLFQKETRLARAEVSAKISTKLQAGVWMAVAGVVGFVAFLVLVETVVFAIASAGLAIYWACLIVGGFLAAVAGIAFLKGRADAQEELTPDRTVRNIRRDISTAKEQLT
ncbi:MAG TPA: phage holin family protein [Xanthobacteraceae bacterium]|jgi:hypothetical protein